MGAPFIPMASRFILIAAAGLLGSTPATSAESSYAAFVTALAAMATSANDVIANDRAAARQIYIRQLVTQKVLAAFPASDSVPPPPTVLKLDDVLDQTTLLCKFRSAKSWTIVKPISARDSTASITLDRLAAIAQQNYLNGTVRQLTDASAQPDTSNILTALKVFLTPPPPTKPDPPGKLSVSDDDRAAIETSCEQDLREFEAAYYGEVIPVVIPPKPAADVAVSAAPAAAPPTPTPFKIPDLSVFGPIGVAVNTALAIITPVIEDFAAIEAQSQAEARVKNILVNNRQALATGGQELGQTVSDYLFAKRLSLAGQFAEQIALVQGDSIDLSSKEVQAACPRPAMYFRGKDGKGPLNGAFMRCYSLIWTHFEKGISTALNTAGTYDQFADTGNTSTALNKFGTMTAEPNYQKIIANSFSATDGFWQEVTQLVTFAGAVATATSADNVKKLEQAFQAAGKGL